MRKNWPPLIQEMKSEIAAENKRRDKQNWQVDQGNSAQSQTGLRGQNALGGPFFLSVAGSVVKGKS